MTNRLLYPWPPTRASGNKHKKIALATYDNQDCIFFVSKWYSPSGGMCLSVRGVFETRALAMIRLNKFPGNLPGVESETRIVSELYIDFIKTSREPLPLPIPFYTLSMILASTRTLGAILLYKDSRLFAVILVHILIHSASQSTVHVHTTKTMFSNVSLCLH